jgi:hypothetical protein
MRRMYLVTMILAVGGVVSALASVLEVPYTGGKIEGTLELQINSGSSVSPDSIRFGGRGGATIRFHAASYALPFVCGAKPTIVAQFLGASAAMWQTPDSSTDWNALTWLHLQRSSLPLIEGWDGSGGTPPPHERGVPLFSAGSHDSCAGEDYVMSPHWNRVVFMHFGDGRDYRGRFSFQVKHDTLYAPTPTLRYRVLKHLTLHYVIAEESNDLSGAPVALNAPRRPRAFGAPSGSVTDLYTPLGVKVRREPGRFEALVPLRR